MYKSYDFISRACLTAMIVAICGGATWLAICQSENPPGIGDLYDMVRLTTAAGAVGGFLAAPLFGTSGRTGLVFSLIGALIATVVGAALAAFAVGGPAGFVIGPIYVLTNLVTEPLAGGVWLLIMATAHHVAEVDKSRIQT